MKNLEALLNSNYCFNVPYTTIMQQDIKNIIEELINPFLANVPILYTLKTPENLWFSGVFRGYKTRALARNGLIYK